MDLTKIGKRQLEELQQELAQAFADCRALGLKLNMARGKPCGEQLDLSHGLQREINEFKDAEGEDVRNYGGLAGIPEARRLFAEILEVPATQVIVGGSSSLNLVYDMVSRAYIRGVLPGAQPWYQQGQPKFLCPSPGYDRHFVISDSFGIKNIPMAMTAHGPDMDEVERLVREDAGVKGIWCVPKYSNPDGVTYSDDTVRRLATMQTAAADFRIFWDNAYCLHHLDMQRPDYLLNIYAACAAAGNADRVYIFASTSKITMAGSGISAMGMSPANYDYALKQVGMQMISYDKMNQLRHLRFLPDMEAVLALMARHAAILKPKFDLVLEILDRELKPLGIGRYHRPRGGYFISFYGPEGTAKRIVSLCQQAGVQLTGAGAAYPYGNDPADSNIRIAPSFPPLAELKQAMEIFCVAAKLATVEKLLAQA